eukprot:SAG31_NODE_1438_length_8338_cov_18.446413_2_plen_200_part_00
MAAAKQPDQPDQPDQPKARFFVLKPAGGLCNRIRTVIAALANTEDDRNVCDHQSRDTKLRPLGLVWQANSACCPCRYSETFEAHPQLLLLTDADLAKLGREQAASSGSCGNDTADALEILPKAQSVIKPRRGLPAQRLDAPPGTTDPPGELADDVVELAAQVCNPAGAARRFEIATFAQKNAIGSCVGLHLRRTGAHLL